MASNIDTDETQNCVKAGSKLLFDFKEQVNLTILNFFPQFADTEFLERIGRDRNAPRYKNEDLDEYRDRVVNAYDYNEGIGKVQDIIRAMAGLDFVFNSHTAGDNSGGVASYNLLVFSIGVEKYDGSRVYDGSIKYDAPEVNDITIEIVQGGPVSQDDQDDIRAILKPVLRASSQVLEIINLLP